MAMGTAAADDRARGASNKGFSKVWVHAKIEAAMRSDVELLDAWRAGDRDAGEALFERHFDAIARFFRNKVQAGVEDLVQRTFLGCVEAKYRFRGDASFRTFLFSIAHRVLGKHLRDHQRNGGLIDFGVTSLHDLSPSPSVVVVQRDERALLLAGLRRIPLVSQVALELYYWERLPAQEVAKVVGVPEGTMRTRLRTAKRQLRAAMDQISVDTQLIESSMLNLEDWAQAIREQAHE